MKFTARVCSLLLIAFIMSLFVTTPVLAIPSLPSSFYGTVKVNSANVPDGTIVQALIDGKVYAEAYTQTYQENSVYALDVRGDDNETEAQDGGREGDAIQFKVGGVLATQTGVWHTGTNININLTVSSSSLISTPKATPTAVPTQTAIVVVIQPSPMPTSITQASSTSESQIQPSQVATKSSQFVPVSTIHPGSQTPTIPFNNKNNGSSSIARVVIIFIILAVAIGIGFAFWTLRKKNV